MNAKEIVESKQFKIFSAVIGIAIIALVSFAGGVAVGLHKAKFSYSWGENYERNFVGGRGGMMENDRWKMMDRLGVKEKWGGRDFRNAHGVAGTVISLSDNNLIINTRENTENTVSVNERTIIKRNGQDILLGSIIQNDEVVVVGRPSEDGTINADFIRIFEQRNTNQ